MPDNFNTVYVLQEKQLCLFLSFIFYLNIPRLTRSTLMYLELSRHYREIIQSLLQIVEVLDT